MIKSQNYLVTVLFYMPKAFFVFSINYLSDLQGLWTFLAIYALYAITADSIKSSKLLIIGNPPPEIFSSSSKSNFSLLYIL